MVFSVLRSYAQCVSFGHTLISTGFNCPGETGDICFTTIPDGITNMIDCDGYELEFEFTTGDFIYVLSNSFYIHSTNFQTTRLRSPIFINPDYNDIIICLSGLIQQPGTIFTLRVVKPNTNHILVQYNFIPDNTVVVGAIGQTTTFSSAIAAQQLLPAFQATTQQMIKSVV